MVSVFAAFEIVPATEGDMESICMVFAYALRGSDIDTSNINASKTENMPTTRRLWFNVTVRYNTKILFKCTVHESNNKFMK